MVYSKWGKRDKQKGWYEKHKQQNQRENSKGRQGDQWQELRVYLRRTEGIYRMGTEKIYARNGDVKSVDQIKLSEARQPGQERRKALKRIC